MDDLQTYAAIVAFVAILQPLLGCISWILQLYRDANVSNGSAARGTRLVRDTLMTVSRLKEALALSSYVASTSTIQVIQQCNTSGVELIDRLIPRLSYAKLGGLVVRMAFELRHRFGQQQQKLHEFRDRSIHMSFATIQETW